MQIRIVTANNLSLGNGISALLRRVVAHMNQKSGGIIAQALQSTVRNHFSSIYPGSSHYAPSKVNKSPESEKNVGAVDIDVPGITRAYHDITIRPVHGKALTIPLHRDAYGHSAREFNDLFVTRNKNGHAFLARNNGGSLTLMYVLAKSAFQKKDSRLMPSDDTLAENIFQRLRPYIDAKTQQEITNV